MLSKTASTLFLHTLSRNCYRLNQQISLHQKRAQLLQMEINGLTEPPSALFCHSGSEKTVAKSVNAFAD